MEQVDQYVIGFDLSTQSIKMLVIETKNLSIVYKHSISFEKDLPDYKTQNGVYIEPINENQQRVTSNSYMFVEAFDILLKNLKQNIDTQKVIAISFAGQQHGSIYWRNNSENILKNLDENQTLLEQFKKNQIFSREKCPIWMDSSSTKQCRDLEQSLGGSQKLCDLTGSRGFERFTGNQISKIIQEEFQETYQQTDHISLISSFQAELFLGKYSQIDTSDGSGMNILDIHKRQWSEEILKHISNQNDAQQVNQKLNDPCLSYQCLGEISQYFVKRYNFKPDCKIIAATGDNPSALVGLGIIEAGEIAISLGTSDTLFGLVNKQNMKTNQKAHIFVSPVDPESQFMLLICTKNGSLVREKYKKLLANDSWETFNNLIEEIEPGNKGKYGIFIEFPEITPAIEKQNFSLCLDSQGNQYQSFDNKGETLRALLEGKIMSLKLNAEQFGITDFKRVLVTGGGSKNQQILQTIADIFGVNVFVDFSEFQQEGCAYGSALRAIHGYECCQAKKYLKFSEVFAGKQLTKFEKAASSRQEFSSVYKQLFENYSILEKSLETKF